MNGTTDIVRRRRAKADAETERKVKGRQVLRDLGYSAATSAASSLLAAYLPDVPVYADRSNIPQLARDAICYVAAGGVLTSFARQTGVSPMTVRSWIKREGLEEQYQQAVIDGTDVMAEHIWLLATTPTTGVSKKIVRRDPNGEVLETIEEHSDMIQARKLIVSAGLDLLRLRNPEKYGNKTTTEVNVVMSDAIAAARRRVSPADVVDVQPRPVAHALPVEDS